MRRASLTGAWSGAYRYPGDAYPETVFNAQIEESGGGFVGRIQEPNILHPWLGAVAKAEIEGVRVGRTVTFAKFYQGGGFEDAVRYEGEADDALLRIEGIWLIVGSWSGTFFMTRDDGEAVEAAEEAEAAQPLTVTLPR